MEYKNLKIEWLGHSGLKIKDNKLGMVIYIDPFKLREDYFEAEKADFIFITHSHYDHCSIEDINKIAKDSTMIICTPDVSSKLRMIDKKVHVMIAEPGNKYEFIEGMVKVLVVPAYNLNKDFHTKEEDWVGYVLNIGESVIYHAGDTDFIPEMKNLANMKIDFAFLPIGGNYTMNAGEAAKAASAIKPKFVSPIHYASISGVGGKSDADVFSKLCSSEGVEVKLFPIS
jgi:L-ascorbate metabolism protein UlaG (beta-lactamase superfamily)